MMRSCPMRAGVLFALLVAGCASGPARLDEAAVRTQGTRRFDAGAEKVWYAVHAALVADGWAPAPSAPRAGPLTTRPRDVGAGTLRAWRVEVTPDGDDGARVVATPRAFDGGRDVSDAAVWTAADEAQRWRALFERTGAILAAWADPPEFLPRGEAAVLDAYRFEKPTGWAGLVVAPNGRAVAMQRGTPGPDGALNPTLLLAMVRTMPTLDGPGFAAAAVRASLRHLGEVEAPASLRDVTLGGGGLSGVGDVALPSGRTIAVRTHVWSARSAAWTLVASLACGADDADCARDFAAFVDAVRASAAEAASP